MLSSVTIKDFSGGWNTASDDTQLPSNMSGDMMDFEVTPTGVLQRRAGVAPYSITPTGASLWAFDWLDTAAGGEYLCTISDGYSGVTQKGFRCVDLVGTRHTTEAQAEDLTWSLSANTSSVNWSDSAAVGGVALQFFNGSGSWSVSNSQPLSNFITVRLRSFYGGTISVRVDSGTTQTTSSTSYTTFTFSGLSTAGHTVYISGTPNQGVIVDTVTHGIADTWTYPGTLSASYSPYGMAQLNNKMYFGGAYTNIQGWSGSGNAAVTGSGTSKGAFIVEHKRRLFAAGAYNDKGVVNYTQTDDPNCWNVADAGSLRFTKDGGSDVNGMAVWNDIVFVTTDRRLYGLDVSDASPANWQAKLLDEVGCVAPRTMIPMPNGVAFLSKDGLRSYGLLPGIGSVDGAGVANLSINIQPTLNTITNYHLCNAAFYNDKIFLSVPLNGSATLTHVLVCDLRRRTENGQPVWYPYLIPNITCMKARHKGSEQGLYAGTSTGKIVKLETGNADNFYVGGATTAISAYYTVPPVKPDKRGFASCHHFKHIHAAVDSDSTQSIVLTPTTDDVYSPAVTAEVTETTAGRPIRANVSSRGRYMRLKIEASALAPLTINELTYTFSKPRMR